MLSTKDKFQDGIGFLNRGYLRKKLLMSEEISSLELISRPDECFNVLEIAVL